MDTSLEWPKNIYQWTKHCTRRRGRPQLSCKNHMKDFMRSINTKENKISLAFGNGSTALSCTDYNKKLNLTIFMFIAHRRKFFKRSLNDGHTFGRKLQTIYLNKFSCGITVTPSIVIRSCKCKASRYKNNLKGLETGQCQPCKALISLIA